MNLRMPTRHCLSRSSRFEREDDCARVARATTSRVVIDPFLLAIEPCIAVRRAYPEERFSKLRCGWRSSGFARRRDESFRREPA